MMLRKANYINLSCYKISHNLGLFKKNILTVSTFSYKKNI